MSKRGENIYLRKDKRWEGRYKNGYNLNGTVKYSSVYGKTYKEVREKLFQKKQENRSDELQCVMTLNQLSEKWLDANRYNLKASTYSNYQIKLRKHILPELGKIKFQSLTAENLIHFSENKINQGLSAKYVSDILALLKSIFKYFHKTCNYMDKSVLIPTIKVTKTEENLSFSEENFKTLRDYLICHSTTSNVGILLAMTTGMRIGELCGLKWEDIDFKKRILTVRRTVQRICTNNEKRTTKIIISPPKSQNSNRVICLPEFIIPYLKSLKKNNEDYLLSERKTPVEPRTVQYRFKKILKILELPSTNFHSLRHTFATKCMQLGLDIKTVSELLGHSTINITLNKYVHSSLKYKAECMEIFSQKFLN